MCLGSTTVHAGQEKCQSAHGGGGSGGRQVEGSHPVQERVQSNQLDHREIQLPVLGSLNRPLLIQARDSRILTATRITFKKFGALQIIYGQPARVMYPLQGVV